MGKGIALNVPHQVASEIKAKTSKRLYHKVNANRVVKEALDKWNILRRPKSKSDSYLGVEGNLDSKRGGKQGELAGTCTCLKCIPNGWLVVAANVGSHDPIRVL
jgi:hypothetical protein